MPRVIDSTEARRLLLTRGELITRGLTDRQLAAHVEAGMLRRLRRGLYVEAVEWADLWREGRHLIEVLATHLNSDEPGPVFWGPSAAVVHGLPLCGSPPKNVHVAILGARHGRTRAGVVWHDVELGPADIVEVGGVRCTSLDRTVLDLACSRMSETAIAAADAALRREAVSGQVQDLERAAAWSARMSRRAERISVRGVRRARTLISLADGRAQSPGESVSRLRMHTLGFSNVALQVHVVGPDRRDYWLDFGFRSARCFGEFDGREKYLAPEMTGGRSIEQVVLDEKRREDAIRGVTGWRTVRWGWEDIRTVDTFSRRLTAFGIRPPG